jgi:hypothetical protein
MADIAPFAYIPRIQSSYEEQIVGETLLEFNALRLWRDTTASHWEEVAELVLPTSRNTFLYGNFNWPGQKKTDRQIDCSGMMALQRFCAICDSLLTPANSYWHGLAAKDDYVMKDRATRLWFEDATRRLFKCRTDPMANFRGQTFNNYENLGAFGNHSMFIDELDRRSGIGLRYRSIPLGELFIRENHQGLVDGVVRWFRMTPEQAFQKWPDTFPQNLLAALQVKSQYPSDFLHRVVPRQDYDPDRIDHKGKPWASYYVSLTGRCLLDEGGFRTFPYAVGRYVQTPGEVYGRSPAMMVLPALKTLNAEKATFLKQGHRIGDPVLLLADDGLLNMNLRPGSLNAGAVSADGQPLVHVLPTGKIDITKEMMDEERQLINDAFLVSLFQILEETPQMTATEVIERVNEKGILLAPTIGRQQSEYFGPHIHRELDIMAYLRLLPPMPPRLREAQGEYSVVYTSPLARAMQAQEVAGWARSIEMAVSTVNATQDPSLLDVYDFDKANRAISRIMAVPESWMASDDDIARKRKARADAQAKQQQIQAAPAAAAMMKARAVQAKAGMGQGQPAPAGGGGLGNPGGMGQQPGQPPLGQGMEPAGGGMQP